MLCPKPKYKCIGMGASVDNNSFVFAVYGDLLDCMCMCMKNHLHKHYKWKERRRKERRERKKQQAYYMRTHMYVYVTGELAPSWITNRIPFLFPLSFPPSFSSSLPPSLPPQIDEDMTAKLDLCHTRFSFMENEKIFRPNWMAPEGRLQAVARSGTCT